MHILSEGVPLTHGEVYALLRRRRDERSAAAHLPFGLQRVQADPHSRTSNQMIQYTKHNYGQQQGDERRSNDGIQRQAVATAAGLGGGASEAGSLLPPTPADVEAMNALLASPAAGHLAVLLTEVRVLHYLAQHVVMSDDGDGRGEVVEGGALQKNSARKTMRAMYGPSTVYDLSVNSDDDDDDEGGDGGDDAERDATSAPASSVKGTEPKTSAASATKPSARKMPKAKREEEAKVVTRRTIDGEEEEEREEMAAAERLMMNAITHTLVGTRSHVRCVGVALAYYERKGRWQERRHAQAIRRLLGTLRELGHWPPARHDHQHHHGGAATAKVEDPSLGRADDEAAARAAALFFAPSSTLTGGRPLLSRPPHLTAMACEDTFLLRGGGDGGGAWRGGNSRRSHGTSGNNSNCDSAGCPVRQQYGNCSSSSSGGDCLLSEEEVMALVAAGPTNPLQVYQLLDHLDDRFHGNEAAVAYFVRQLVGIFTAA